jgi:GTP diphosphokinase / guanosine-3',5'-bis(diphosphate) 3'-diphosphatase
MVKLADMICNLRDLAHSPPIDWPIDRKRVYFDWGRQVLDRLRGVCPQLEGLFDQAMALRT